MAAIYAIVGVVAALILLKVIVYFSKRAARRKCKNCKTHYTDECVDWHVISNSYSDSSQGASTHAKVEVVCTCPNCGMVRKFKKKVLTGSVSASGRVSSYDIDTAIAKYLKL